MSTNISYREMYVDEVNIYAKIINMSDVQSEKLYKHIRDNGGWVLEAIEKRFNANKVQADHKAMIMILSIGNGVIGKCAWLVEDVVLWCRKHDKTKVTLTMLMQDIYPQGFPVI